MLSRTKKNIVEFLVDKLFSIGIDVVGITFDGCASNISMAKLLGAKFAWPEMNPIITINGHQIQVCLDPCHMVKLIRNAFAEGKYNMIDKNGRIIKWEFIVRLCKLQDTEGLHLANKLSKRHVEFKRHIMKVRIAAQTLSNSVADALDYCNHILKLPGFKDSDATSDFLRMINTSFDVLNSRNLCEQQFKKPLNKTNYQEIYTFTIKAIEYVSNLKIENPDQDLVVNSSRKTGFLGLILGLKSIDILYWKYIDSGILSFLPYYKLNQDHLELFFCAVRSKLGGNTNPTSRQFKEIYRKLLGMCEISERGLGNCIPLEDIKVLNSSSAQIAINNSSQRRTMIDENEYDDDQQPIDIKEIREHDYCFDPSRLTLYVQNTVEYIAGFVVRKLAKKLHCELCIESLHELEEKSDMTLIKFKNKGGLTTPSTDVTELCKIAEKLQKE